MTAAQKSALEIIHVELIAIYDRLETIKNDVEDAYSERSEKWQESEAGETEKTILYSIETALSSLEDTNDVLEEAKN